jgi:hypothetical protein
MRLRLKSHTLAWIIRGKKRGEGGWGEGGGGDGEGGGCVLTQWLQCQGVYVFVFWGGGAAGASYVSVGKLLLLLLLLGHRTAQVDVTHLGLC